MDLNTIYWLENMCNQVRLEWLVDCVIVAQTFLSAVPQAFSLL